MTAKRIFSFVLRIVVVVGIVLGLYFGISAIVESKRTTQISEVSALAKIDQKSNTLNTEIEAELDGNHDLAASRETVARRCVFINKFLIEYFDYYVRLASFENSPNGEQKANIIEKINQLSKQINESQTRLNNLKNCSIAEERERRFVRTMEVFFEETKNLFEIDELLKDYVYKVNYKTDCTGIVYEAQLEMLKDYCKAMFDEYIYGKHENVGETDPLTTSLYNTSFTSVLNKFNGRGPLDTNSDVEVYFAQDYMKINKDALKTMFLFRTDTQKEEYITSITSAVNSAENQTLQRYLLETYRYMELATYGSN